MILKGLCPSLFVEGAAPEVVERCKQMLKVTAIHDVDKLRGAVGNMFKEEVERTLSKDNITMR